MTPEKFMEIVREMQGKTSGVLVDKSIEYSRNNERFHAFISAGRRLGCDPIQALVGMKEKHSVSLADMLEDLKTGVLPTRAMLDEKFGDEINYLFLEYAMFRERIESQGVLKPERFTLSESLVKVNGCLTSPKWDEEYGFFD